MPKIIAELRENILLQARSLLLDGDSEAFTIRAVASACHIAVGTVYNYFSSKEVLMASVMLQDWQSALNAMKTQSALAFSPLEGLRSIHRELLRFWDIYRDVWRRYGESSPAAPLYGPYRQELIRQLEAIIYPLLTRFHCICEDALPAFLAEALLSSAREGEASFERIAPILSRLVKA